MAASHVHATNDPSDLKTGGSSSSRPTSEAEFPHVADFKVRLSGDDAKVPRLSQPDPRLRKRRQVTMGLGDIYEVTLSGMQEFEKKDILQIKGSRRISTKNLKNSVMNCVHRDLPMCNPARH